LTAEKRDRGSSRAERDKREKTSERTFFVRKGKGVNLNETKEGREGETREVLKARRIGGGGGGESD